MAQSYSSDPEIEATRARAEASWRERSPAHVRDDQNSQPLHTWTSRKWLVAGALTLAAIAYGMFSKATPIVAGGAPNWNISISSGSHKPVKMLAYGEHAGLHMITVDPVKSNLENATQLPIKLREGPVWMFALSFSPIEVRAKAPPNSGGVISYGARGHVVKLLQNGVKVW
ncbi:MAG: hypothetical protein ABJC26_14930 [Gemmatimonadaceae bacterium]